LNLEPVNAYDFSFSLNYRKYKERYSNQDGQGNAPCENYMENNEGIKLKLDKLFLFIYKFDKISVK